MPENADTLPLRDIIAPLEQGWWPPAPGWWLMAAVLLIIIIAILRSLIKYATPEYAALRKAALNELAQLQQQAAMDDRLFAEQISTLLKRIAIVRYAPQQPAGLNGRAWLDFLDQTSPKQAFSQAGGKALLEAQYQARPSINRDELINAADDWIRAI